MAHLFRKGRLVMTQPTVVFFGPDGSRFESGKNKIYLRTMLYSTAKEDRYLKVFMSRCGAMNQNRISTFGYMTIRAN